jgi:hypothetical protein
LIDFRERWDKRQTFGPMRKWEGEREHKERNRELLDRIEAEAKTESEPRADEQEEEEPNTEYEDKGIVANGTNERFVLPKYSGSNEQFCRDLNERKLTHGEFEYKRKTI